MHQNQFMESFIASFIIFVIPLALLTGYLAHRKGYSFFPFFIGGLLMLIVALPLAIFIGKNEQGLKLRALEKGLHPCPHCSNYIPIQLTKCPFCRGNVTPEALASTRQPAIDVSFSDLSTFPKGSQIFKVGERTIAMLPNFSIIEESSKSVLLNNEQIENLKQLSFLKSEGALTEEEFLKEKQKLLHSQHIFYEDREEFELVTKSSEQKWVRIAEI